MPDSSTFTIVLGMMGWGQVHQILYSHLAQRYQVAPITLDSSASQISSCSLVISCSDTWSAETLYPLNRQCIQLGVALLPVYTYFQVGIIGPCTLPNMAGCVTCADQRKLARVWDDAEREFLLQQRNAPRNLAINQQWLTAWNVEVLVQLTLAEVDAYVHAPEQLRTRQALIYLALDTLRSSLHSFLPVADCPVCGRKQPDTPEQAAIVLQSRGKPDPFSYHVRNLAANISELLISYVDPYIGVIGAIISQHPSVQPRTTAFIGAWSSDNGHRVLLGSAGSATRWDQSRVVAIAEALERCAGLYPHKKHIAIRASYHQLDVPALDPTTLGLHSPDQYARKNFVFAPYHHDLITNWVWGYSFQQRQPLLVPETCAYYGGSMQGTRRDTFVYEISNGCALGGNREEAILHGILEVAERDAFLLTWYAQLPLPRLDLMSITDPSLRLFIKQLEYVSGYTLIAFNATLDHAVPCLWVMAVDEQQRSSTPRVFCVGGSHPHPERALIRALQELGAMLIPPVDAETFAQERERLLKMLHDPFQVQRMEDHARLYWLPEAFDRLSFLYHSPRRQSFQEAFRDFYCQPPSSMDLRDDLNGIIDHYLRHGIDILVVDQTTPEQELHDLYCVKVLMPGTLSMTFGHTYRRTTNCQRLYQLPHALGYRERALTEADINPHPHPFP